MAATTMSQVSPERRKVNIISKGMNFSPVAFFHVPAPVTRAKSAPNWRSGQRGKLGARIAAPRQVRHQAEKKNGSALDSFRR